MRRARALVFLETSLAAGSSFGSRSAPEPAAVSKGITTFEDAGSSRLAAKDDFQLCVHAIGDRTNRTLTPGKLAGVTVLSRDIMTVPEEQILGTRVLYAIIGGKVVYRSSD